MEMTLIRHAQPEWAKDGLGKLDPDLTDLGIQQSERLAESSGAWTHRPTELWVSPAARARQTAEPLARALGLEPVVMDWLLEIQLPPHWQDQPSLEIRSVFESLKGRDVAQWWQGVPGGETFRDFLPRITDGLDGALADRGFERNSTITEAPVYAVQETSARICVVAHGGTNSVVTSALLGLPQVPWSWERLVIAHAALTRMQSSEILGGHIFGLRALSDLEHLPKALRTR